MQIKVKAAAKINLMLDIVAQRNDGYHDLFMVMQSVSLCDEITVEATKSRQIVITCSESALPVDKTNIAHKAAKAFFKYTAIKNPGLEIHIEKRIPFAAGMAGGSADGAAVIVALNKIFNTDLSDKQLCEIGVTVGADVPFCIRGGTLLAQGVGDILNKLRPLKRCYILLAKPDYGVNTAGAYASYDEHGRLREPDKLGMLKAVQSRNIEDISRLMANCFEEFIEVPDRVQIKSVMQKHGAKGSCMSGSGPTVFGIFTDKTAAEGCASELKGFVKDVIVCLPKKLGCEIVEDEK